MRNRNRKPIGRRAVCLFAAAALLAGSLLPVGAGSAVTAKAADVTSDVTVTVKSFTAQNPDGEEITVKKGDAVTEDASAYSVKTPAQRGHSAQIAVDLTKSGGKTFADGDEITIPTYAYAATGSRTNAAIAAPTDWTDLSDSKGTVIGQWKLEGSPTTMTTRTIHIKLNSRAAGQAVLSDVTMDLGSKGIISYGVGYDVVAKLKIGDTMFSYGILEREKTEFKDSVFQALSGNNMATCGIRTGSQLYTDLINSRGKEGTPQSVLFETLYENATSVDFIRSTAANAAPFSLTDPEGCFVTDYLTPNFASALTEVTPKSGESYDAFKTRVMAKPLQYGFYKVDEGVRLVYYGGVVGKDTPKYSEYRTDDMAEVVASAMIEQGWYKESDHDRIYQIYKAAIHDNAITGEHITATHFAVQVNYDTVLEDTKYPAETVITYNPGKSDATSKTYKQTVSLTGMFGSISVKPFSATIMKYDADTTAALAGASVKLQLKQADGSWKDYTANDGGALTRTTDSKGLLTFANLGLGTYRAVETKAPTGYSLTDSKGYDAASKTVISSTFTISANDTEGAKVQMANKRTPQKATVTYKDQTADNKVLKTDSFIGDAGATMTYDADTVIKTYTAQGYELVSNDYMKGTKFDEDDAKDQSFTVILKHGTSSKEEKKTVKRTIHYVYGAYTEDAAHDNAPEPGSKAADDVTQTVSFTRTAITDNVTKNITYTAYTPATAKMDAVKSPEIFNYTASVEQVAAYDAKAADQDMTVTVTYTQKPDQKATIIIRDEDNGTDLHAEHLAGPGTTAIGYDVSTDLNVFLAKGYELVENPYPGPETTYDEDASVDQEWIVTVKPIIERITPDDPRIPDDPMNPDGTPYPEGLDHDALNKTITRTIHYIYGDYNDNANHENTPEPGSQAAPDVIQTADFAREALVNHVTSEVTYEAYQPENADLPEEASPEIVNFTASKDLVEAVTITAEDQDMEETVSYIQKDDQKARIIIRDQDSKEDLFTKELDGPEKTAFGYTVTEYLNSILNKGYQLVENPYPGEKELFDDDASTDQEYVILVKKIPEETTVTTPEKTTGTTTTAATPAPAATSTGSDDGKGSAAIEAGHPKTGDTMHTLPYVIAIAGAGAAIALLAMRRAGKKQAS